MVLSHVIFIFYVSVAITRSHVIVETQVKRIVSDGYTLTDDYHPLLELSSSSEILY